MVGQGMGFTAGSGRPHAQGRVRASVSGAHIVDKLEEEVGLGVGEYLNTAPDAAEAVRGVLLREVYAVVLVTRMSSWTPACV